jgi:phytoene synthase
VGDGHRPVHGGTHGACPKKHLKTTAHKPLELAATMRAMTPEQYVQQKAAASGSSFYYAFLFLPRERRAAITAFYAFCREVDDVVDEISDAQVAQTKLAWWRREVHSAFAGQPSHPVMQALMPLAPVYGITAAHLEAVIEGCQMDLTQTRYLDYAGLKKYCHLVAGLVGEVAAKIFGQTDPATTHYAHTLGLAFQLTNILRDVGEDAMRGRIYLPIDELKQFDVKSQDLIQRQYSERFTALMKFQAARAHALYEEAFALLPAADKQAQKPGLMMASIYRTLLREIEADNFQVLHQRIALTPLRKLWLAWKVQALGRL